METAELGALVNYSKLHGPEKMFGQRKHEALILVLEKVDEAFFPQVSPGRPVDFRIKASEPSSRSDT